MKIADLKVGDVLEDYRRGVRLTITEIAPCGSCPCGWGEISFEEERRNRFALRRTKTFRQFERLQFLRRVEP